MAWFRITEDKTWHEVDPEKAGREQTTTVRYMASHCGRANDLVATDDKALFRKGPKPPAKGAICKTCSKMRGD